MVTSVGDLPRVVWHWSYWFDIGGQSTVRLLLTSCFDLPTDNMSNKRAFETSTVHLHWVHVAAIVLRIAVRTPRISKQPALILKSKVPITEGIVAIGKFSIIPKYKMLNNPLKYPLNRLYSLTILLPIREVDYLHTCVVVEVVKCDKPSQDLFCGYVLEISTTPPFVCVWHPVSCSQLFHYGIVMLCCGICLKFKWCIFFQ